MKNTKRKEKTMRKHSPSWPRCTLRRRSFSAAIFPGCRNPALGYHVIKPFPFLAMKAGLRLCRCDARAFTSLTARTLCHDADTYAIEGDIPIPRRAWHRRCSDSARFMQRQQNVTIFDTRLSRRPDGQDGANPCITMIHHQTVFTSIRGKTTVYNPRTARCSARFPGR